MYNSFQLASKYLHYLVTAQNGHGHGMHSPFVFDFIRNVLRNKKDYRHPLWVESVRSALQKTGTYIDVDDFGAGSRVAASSSRKVSSIARSALKPPKYGKLLHRVAAHYQPKTILELGTSFGITTSYLATANPSARVITIEGSGAVADIAQEQFTGHGLHHVELHRGRFEDVLPAILPGVSSLDLCYIDGNHRLEPTLDYFHQIKPFLHEGSIVIFDDIHWSREMEAAWMQVVADESVQCSIDLFFLGFIFFKKGFRVKQDFVIRF